MELNGLGGSYWHQTTEDIDRKMRYSFSFEAPETEFLIAFHKEAEPEVFSGAFDFLIGQIKELEITDNKSKYITGILKGYEFKTKDTNSLINRNASQKTEINLLRSQFERLVSEAEKQLNNQLTATEQQLNKSLQTSANELSKQIESVEKLTKSNMDEISRYIETKTKAFDQWLNEKQTQEQKFTLNSKINIKTLESTYEEKLRLSEPAKY